MKLGPVVVCNIWWNSRYNELWNWVGIFLSIELGILSCPGALLLPKYLRHRSYVFLSNVLAKEAFSEPLFSRTYPLRSCHGYCLTPHTHSGL
jgi:hypothetical protein